MTTGDYDEAGRLRPTYNVARPRWAGKYTNREYKRPACWWSELGHSDQLTLQKKLLPIRYPIRENDPEWYDPKVPDGTSMSGPFGMDAKYTPDYTYKADTPGNLFDFKQNVMKTSLQYKQIAEKYDISPEHPGIDVSPTLSTLHYDHWQNLGIRSIIPTQILHQYGPRFFDKPMNEGCLEKGLALVKYVGFANLLVVWVKFQNEPSKDLKTIVVPDMAKRWLRTMPFPSALAFGYGITICTSATIRSKDDIYNPLWAAIATGVISATIKNNVTLGVSIGLSLAVLGTVWHYQRITRHGLQGPSRNPSTGDQHHGGPHYWKLQDFGHSKVPTEIY